MKRTYAERVLDYLWSAGPDGATNSQISEVTGIDSHQQVYLITQTLVREGRISSRKSGRNWVYFVTEPTVALMRKSGIHTFGSNHPVIDPLEFEEMARQIFSERLGVPLIPGQVNGIPHLFDLVSSDQVFVGDVMRFTLNGGLHLTSEKFAIISEHVWLMEKFQAKSKFLVFGEEIEVPRRWLSRFGKFKGDVAFYFLSNEGAVHHLD